PKAVSLNPINPALLQVDIVPLVPKLLQTDEPNLSVTTIVEVPKELLKVSMVDVAPLVPKLRKNRIAHTDYIMHTQKEAATLKEIVESERFLVHLTHP
nr:hypothetical protein [Tanacetum cinerariifolium]